MVRFVAPKPARSPGGCGAGASRCARGGEEAQCRGGAAPACSTAPSDEAFAANVEGVRPRTMDPLRQAKLPLRPRSVARPVRVHLPVARRPNRIGLPRASDRQRVFEECVRSRGRALGGRLGRRELDAKATARTLAFCSVSVGFSSHNHSDKQNVRKPEAGQGLTLDCAAPRVENLYPSLLAMLLAHSTNMDVVRVGVLCLLRRRRRVPSPSAVTPPSKRYALGSGVTGCPYHPWRVIRRVSHASSPGHRRRSRPVGLE